MDWPSHRKAAQLSERATYRGNAVVDCRDAAITQRRNLIAFFSNPEGDAVLNELPREMRDTVLELNPVDYVLCPAARECDVTALIEIYKPRILCFSIHAEPAGLAFALENNLGKRDEKSVSDMVKMMHSAYQKAGCKPECVILNCCTGHHLADALSKVFKKCSFVYWKTLVEDPAAKEFVQGLFADLKDQFEVQDADALDYKRAFQAACRAFKDGSTRYKKRVINEDGKQVLIYDENRTAFMFGDPMKGSAPKYSFKVLHGLAAFRDGRIDNSIKDIETLFASKASESKTTTRTVHDKGKKAGEKSNSSQSNEKENNASNRSTHPMHTRGKDDVDDIVKRLKSATLA